MNSEPQLHQVDVLVIGAGTVGLTAALSVPEHLSVAILTKDPGEGSTRWAQGGVVAVIDEKDSVESHIRDTLDCRRSLCHQCRIVKMSSDELTCEGGHSYRMRVTLYKML